MALAAVPEDARVLVAPFLDAIIAAMHEAFSLATGTAFWLGIAAVTVAFVVLLPLREVPLPLERLAELRGRTSPDAAPDSTVAAGS